MIRTLIISDKPLAWKFGTNLRKIPSYPHDFSGYPEIVILILWVQPMLRLIRFHAGARERDMRFYPSPVYGRGERGEGVVYF